MPRLRHRATSSRLWPGRRRGPAPGTRRHSPRPAGARIVDDHMIHVVEQRPDLVDLLIQPGRQFQRQVRDFRIAGVNARRAGEIVILPRRSVQHLIELDHRRARMMHVHAAEELVASLKASLRNSDSLRPVQGRDAGRAGFR